jgi:hypothetical protein
VSEYRQYKRLVVESFSNSSLSSCAELIFINYYEILPNLVRLLLSQGTLEIGIKIANSSSLTRFGRIS